MNANHALWQFCVPEPTLQNHCHTQALEDALKVPSTAVYSVVAFVGHSQLEGNLPANVMQGQECVRFMRSLANLLWSNAEVQQLIEQLEMKRIAPTRATRRMHVRQIRQRHRARSRNTCAACGSSMVLPTARSGAWTGKQFWCCSCYPNCQAVQSV